LFGSNNNSVVFKCIIFALWVMNCKFIMFYSQ
jgi:hypothetical protein